MRYLRCFVLLSIAIVINTSYANEIVPISNFDSSKYLGNWYEIARLPNIFEKKCIAPIMANYSINPDDDSQIVVINTCNTKDHATHSVTGVAHFVESSNIGKLKVTFLPKWLRYMPFGYGDYWIIYTDYDKIAIVGSPDHDYLWILSRTQNIATETLRDAIELGRQYGFDISKLIVND